MAEHANDAPNQNNCDNQAMGFIRNAAEACASGDYVLGMHLYMAAYEKASADDGVPANVGMSALREAWNLACDLKERSLAEYVFEKLEPYLTGDEIAECAMKLQELALDRLEEYGFSREDLEDMAETISQDILGDSAHVVKVESMSIPNMGMFGMPNVAAEAAIVEKAPQIDATAEKSEPVESVNDQGLSDNKAAKPPHVQMGVADVNDFNPYDMYDSSSVGKSYHVATNEGAGAYVFTRDVDRAHALERAEAQAAEQDAAETASDEQGAAQGKDAPEIVSQPAEAVSLAAQSDGQSADDSAKVDLSKFVPPLFPVHPPRENGESNAQSDDAHVLNYQNLAGYDDAVAIMRDLGVGMQNDAGFIGFVRMLNSRHGLNRMPAIDTLLFRAPVIEDAARFAEATAGELGLPVLRMSMEEGMGGAPVLCVTTQENNRPRMNHARNRFEGPGILVIDDLDAWTLPEAPENPEGLAGFVMANMSRGAREAVSLIRSAVEDPDVYVLVTASTTGESDPFFYDLLEPITIVDIGYPNDKERADMWAEIVDDHPSMRGVNRDDLVTFTKGMARYDMYMAAREALEEAYKIGLVQRMYVPVTPQNLFDKIAACQPLDSDLYRGLEQAIVDDFKSDLEHLEDILGEQGQA